MPMTALRYWIVWTLFVTTKASTPNVIVSINGVEQTWLAKRGLFGSDADRVQGRLVHAPAYDELLCEYYMDRENSTITPLVPPEPWIMMVPRGMCTFERKAYAAKVWYGASGVLIYDNLSARYQWNNETSKVTYPRDEWDYECSNGYGFVYNIELDPPAYGRRTLDPILDQTSPNTNCTFELTRETCDSQLCLVTGPAATNTSKYPVCCAWDLPLTMTGDDSAGDTDDVVAIFLTVRQGQALLQHVGKVSVVEARPYQPFNISMIFLWMMAVIITFVASYFAAADFRIFRVALARYQDTKNARQQPAAEQPDNEEQRNGAQAAGNNELEELVLGLDDLNSDDEEDDEGTPLEESSDDEGDQADESHEDEPLEPEQETNSKEKKKWALHSLPPKAKEPKQGPNTWALYSLPPEQRKPKTKRKRPGFKAEQTAETDILPTDGGKPLPEPWATPIGGFEMTHWHVFGFVVLASAMLILLFFFRFYHVVFIFYGFGCAGSVSHLIFGPLLVRVVPKFGDGIVKELNKSVVCGLNGFDITSQLLGYIWAIVWIWYVPERSIACIFNIV